MRVAVAGGCDFTDNLMIARVLGALRPEITLVHGGASGVDVLAALWWSKGGRPMDVHRADWLGPCRPQCKPGHRLERIDETTLCPVAGAYRDQEMVDSGLDMLLAFPDRADYSAELVARCRAAGVIVLSVS